MDNVLARILRNEPAQAPPEERCDFCAKPLGETHSHLVDLQDRRLMCSCRPCYLVFLPSGAAHGRYKTVPERYLHLEEFHLSDAAWDQLQIPIGLAFFFYNSSESKTVCFYPGPAGAMESQLPLDAWSGIAALEPRLGELQSDVEAFLVRRGRSGDPAYFIVPIDVCYQLVGLIRLHWKGFDGGSEARAKIDEFFAGLHDRSRALPGGVTHT